ncbi:hypothetical protein QLQ12_32840 [Actinoplanes sp. NEAU-A12]|uniref:Uncharacterized protein n=1 Tax=Actinoplanes sandaracinus TaxID=3045177 RepID=A0ABT6WUI5_9ACTN|nr:hypothetical protein [Actinoplanes sandaracinus]MDI6103407.1 hypothetical protein [Actinoplanes sandaracinus]
MRRIVMAALAAMLGTFAAVPAYAEPAGVTTTDVTFAGADGVVLHGTVLTPAHAGTGTRRPGIVMLEGAGNRGREYRSSSPGAGGSRQEGRAR